MFGRKEIAFGIGFLLNAIGIWLIFLSGLGTHPLDSVSVGLFTIFGLSIGTWYNILSLLLIIAAAIISKSKLNLYSLFVSLSFGFAFDILGVLFFNRILLMNLDIAYKLMFFVCGILISSIGVNLYILTDYPVSALDNLMISIRDEFNWSLTRSRFTMDSILTLLGLILKGPIGIGTLLIVFLFSRSLSYLEPIVFKIYSQFLPSSYK